MLGVIHVLVKIEESLFYSRLNTPRAMMAISPIFFMCSTEEAKISPTEFKGKCMSKGQDSKKTDKKKPEKTMKEKRQDKKEKKANKK